eukprot:1853761-Prorocentrum_lima.AAC.1
MSKKEEEEPSGIRSLPGCWGVVEGRGKGQYSVLALSERGCAVAVEGCGPLKETGGSLGSTLENSGLV